MRIPVLTAIAGIALALGPTVATSQSQSVATAAAGASGALAQDLARIRQATQRFRDINVAFAEGYLIPPPGECVTAEAEGQPKQLGAMGVHVIRPDLLGITAVSPRINGVGTHTDFTRPAVLVYEPQPGGGYELVAIENLVFAQAWHAAGNTAPPSFHGNQYYAMTDNPLTAADEAHGFEPHYELHIWLYRHNPAGMFMQFNAAVKCPGSSGH
jgi:hypothetical protein